MVMKDGSMLVSDDYNGAVCRVSYGNARSGREEVVPRCREGGWVPPPVHFKVRPEQTMRGSIAALALVFALREPRAGATL